MIVTRFAPSPTGRLHSGHAFSAALGPSSGARSGGQIPASDRGSRPGAQPARVRRRHFRGPALARPRLGRAGAGPVGADARPMPMRSMSCGTRGLVYRLLLHPRGHRAVADRAARRCGDILSGNLPRASRRSRAPRRRRRIAGGSIPRRRWKSRACRPGRRATVSASRPSERRSATRFSPGRTRLPAIICPASSTMRRAA